MMTRPRQPAAQPASRALLLALPLVLAGCGAPVIDQRQLKVVPGTSALVFEREFRYDISRENDLPRPQPGQFRGLLKGTYTARYEDATGTYYANDNACVIYGTDLARQLKFVSTGGIWVARSPTAEPAFRLYWIAGRPGPLPTPLAAEPACGEITASGGASPQQGVPVDLQVTMRIVDNTAPRADPAAAGAGAGLAVALIDAIAEYERGKIIVLPAPVSGSKVQGAYRLEPR